MNTLPNGALAVGAPGSWMRLQAAYEHTANLDSFLAECILHEIRLNNIRPTYNLRRAAIACGIEPTTDAIRAYLIAARKEMDKPATGGF